MNRSVSGSVNFNAVMNHHSYGKSPLDEKVMEIELDMPEVVVAQKKEEHNERNKVLSDSDLDILLEANTLETTKKQTKWASTQFKGIDIFLVLN